MLLNPESLKVGSLWFGKTECSMICRFCGSPNIRISRWRRRVAFDASLPSAPVRCRDCVRHDYRNLFVVLGARSKERERRQKEDSKGNS